MPLNETRTERINPQLTASNWDIAHLTQVRLEVPVAGYDPTPWNGFTDYSLCEPSGNVIAVVEAKRTATHPRQGEELLRRTQGELAQRSGVAQTEISRIERGQKAPTLDTYTRLAPALGLNVRRQDGMVASTRAPVARRAAE